MTTAHIIHQVHPLDLTADLIKYANRLLADASIPQRFVAIINDTHVNLSLQPPNPEPPKPMTVIEVPLDDIVLDKELRRDIDAQIQRLKSATPSRERSLTITKLQEAVMWLGMDLKRINEETPGSSPNPYPNSKDPSNLKIEPTADGLKL
jgi:hypothetical protein